MAASIPLNCNICPKQPVFSDISHLLTHVGSKGHLSHYFKAQVRGGQDPAVRNQLDIYDRWYTDNHIEGLLAQRMVLKDSKRPNGIARASNKERVTSIKPSKTSQAARKKNGSVNTELPPPKTNSNNSIDPRLSQVSEASARQTGSQNPSPFPSSPGFDLTSVYRAPEPRMRTFCASTSKSVSPPAFHSQLLNGFGASAATEEQRNGSDTENGGRELGKRGVAKPYYPEPPTTQSTSALAQSGLDLPLCRPANRGRRKSEQRGQQDDVETEEDFIPRAPELKGTFYPGMSLFDSASLDAQKKRNQRKHDSLIGQIEQESLDVECNEYIYWPDGSLKLCRFITGDVQSTPPKEDTPPPPPAKRRRGRKPKGADGVANKKKPRKSCGSQTPNKKSMHEVKRDISPSQAFGWPRGSTRTIDSFLTGFGRTSTQPLTEAEEDEWFLHMGESVLRHHQSPPMSLGEDYATSGRPGVPTQSVQSPSRSPLRHYPFGGGEYTHARRPWASDKPLGSVGLSKASSTGSALSTSKATSMASTRRTTLDSQATCSIAELGKENIPPHWKHPKPSVERLPQDAHTRTNHRYTMTHAGHDARIFSTLPAEMAFAGMATPPVYRISLNPLNPNAHLRQSLPYSNNYTPFYMPGVSSCQEYGSETTLTRAKSVVEDDTAEDADAKTFI